MTEQTAQDPADEIAQLKARLAFYESFDQVIQANISQSSSLLHQAAETQEAAHRALANVSARSEAARAAQRSEFRGLFATMLDEVTTLQGGLERLARRVADTLDDLETDLPGAPVSPPPAVAELSSGEDTVTPSTEPPAEPIAPGVTSEDLDASSPSDEEPAGLEPFSPEEYVAGVRQTPTDELPLPGDPVPEEPLSRGATVLMHGVARATVALSLKRFLENLPDIDKVEPREYAEGVLRLRVLGSRPLTIADLQRWPEGAGLEPINVRADLLEVRLNH